MWEDVGWLIDQSGANLEGDIYRGLTFFNKWDCKVMSSPVLWAWNRNKKSIAVDMENRKQGKNIILQNCGGSRCCC